MICDYIERWTKSVQGSGTKQKEKEDKGMEQSIIYPPGFFDGVSQGGRCRCGIWIKVSKDQEFWIR